MDNNTSLILHISDLHIVKSAEWYNFKNTLIENIRDKSRQYPEAKKALIITGDYHNYSQNDYDSSLSFLKEIIKEMGIYVKSDVFLIPGNHDLANKNKYNEMVKESSSTITPYEAYTATVSSVRNGEQSISDVKSILLPAFFFYNKFAQDLGVYDPGTNASDVHVRKWRDRLQILHLNTALVSDGKTKDNQQLDIDLAAKVGDEIREEDLPCISLGHNDFYDILQSQQQNLKGIFYHANISAYLCGDKHKIKNIEARLIYLKENTRKNTIPNIVCYKSCGDDKDDYSDFGFIWHIWHEDSGEVDLEYYTWEKDNQSQVKEDKRSENNVYQLLSRSKKSSDSNSEKDLLSSDVSCKSPADFEAELCSRSSQYIDQTLSKFFKGIVSDAFSDIDHELWQKAGNVFKPICRYRIGGDRKNQVNFSDTDNFYNIIMNRLVNNDSINRLNIRGEVSTGKSSLMIMLYHYLLLQYQKGSFLFFPVYYNVRRAYCNPNARHADTVVSTLRNDFFNNANPNCFFSLCRNYAETSGAAVCFLIDGLDDTDHFGASGASTVERHITDTLYNFCKESGSFFIASWNQYDFSRSWTNPEELPPNTEKKSDVMYVNAVDTSDILHENRMNDFVLSYCKIRGSASAKDTADRICTNIKLLQLQSINLHFLHIYYDFLAKEYPSDTSALYNELFSHIEEMACVSNWKERGKLSSVCTACYEMVYNGEKLRDMARLNITNFDFQKFKVNKILQNYLIAKYYSDYYQAPSINSVSNDEEILGQFFTRPTVLFIRSIINDINTINHAVTDRINAGHRIPDACISLSAYLSVCCDGKKLLKENTLKLLTGCALGCPNRAVSLDELCSAIVDTTKKWVKENKAREYGLTLASLRSILIAKIGWHEQGNSPERKKAAEAYLKLLFTNSDFREYCRYYQRAYFEDMGPDVLDEPFWEDTASANSLDYLNCFGVLYGRLYRRLIIMDNWESQIEEDLFTLCDLTMSRLLTPEVITEANNTVPTFFYSYSNNNEWNQGAFSIINKLNSLLSIYINNYEKQRNGFFHDNCVIDYFKNVRHLFFTCEKKILKDNGKKPSDKKPYLTMYTYNKIYEQMSYTTYPNRKE